MRRHLLIQPTWRCQNKCSYCWVNQTVLTRPEQETAPERPVEDWIRALKRESDVFVDIAGGEPLLLDWLPDLIAACPHVGFGISTNAIAWEGARKLVAARLPNLGSINASYHPESAKRFRGYDQRYRDTVRLLRSVYPVIGSVVLANDNQDTSKAMADWLRSIGAHVVLSPYEESGALGDLLPGGLTCKGGIAHLTIAPDGSAWPCLTTLRSPYWREACLGNWLDGDIDLSRKPTPCHLACHDYYVLRERHESGDMWGVDPRPVEGEGERTSERVSASRDSVRVA